MKENEKALKEKEMEERMKVKPSWSTLRRSTVRAHTSLNMATRLWAKSRTSLSRTQGKLYSQMEQPFNDL